MWAGKSVWLLGEERDCPRGVAEVPLNEHNSLEMGGFCKLTPALQDHEGISRKRSEKKGLRKEEKDRSAPDARVEKRDWRVEPQSAWYTEKLATRGREGAKGGKGGKGVSLRSRAKRGRPHLKIGCLSSSQKKRE